MKPLLTTPISIHFFLAFLAAGPLAPRGVSLLKSDNGTFGPERQYKESLEYIFLAYDIADVFLEEDIMNLDHDDNNRCMFVRVEEGMYSYTSPANTDPSAVCSLYIVTDPSQLVEFQFMEFSVSCSDGGLVSLIDGWELNGQFFPSEVDHPLPRDKRYMEFCGSSPPVTKYVTHQNVGLIEFRIPNPGQGFRVLVKFHENPAPCNVLMQVPHGSYTIQNFGRKVNCSVSILFPSTLTLTAMDIKQRPVDAPNLSAKQEKEASLERQCRSRGQGDYVEIRGGNDLDPMFMATYNEYCGLFPDHQPEPSANNSLPTTRPPRVDVGCGTTVMRLVSSGERNNTVSFQMELFFDTQTSPCTRKKTETSG